MPQSKQEDQGRPLSLRQPLPLAIFFLFVCFVCCFFFTVFHTSSLSSGTATLDSSGSMVQKGKFSAGAAELVMALKKVDFLLGLENQVAHAWLDRSGSSSSSLGRRKQ